MRDISMHRDTGMHQPRTIPNWSSGLTCISMNGLRSTTQRKQNPIIVIIRKKKISMASLKDEKERRTIPTKI